MGKWIKKTGGSATLPIIAHVINSLSSSNPTVNAPSIKAVNDALARSWENFYPVGSIYMSTLNVSPSSLFGGTWEPIKDKFILASGDTYDNGDTGGAASVSYTPQGSVSGHALTETELPSHTHNYVKADSFTNEYALKVADIPAHTHQTDGVNAGVGQTGDVTFHVPSEGTTVFVDQTIQTQTSGSAGGGGGHSHGINGTQTPTSSVGSGNAHTHNFTGASADLNNMPPYLAVNVWVRTA